jgi:BirA family transcriptional regulator, biotin operon repressor / biotin---[acetyl-CoA-carboxylase] ligase
VAAARTFGRTLMPRRAALVRLLADGELHSGEALAQTLGVTRAAVAKQVRTLARWGLGAESLPRRGYRLQAPLELLDAARIESALGPEARARLRTLEVHLELESTNSRLLAKSDLEPGRWYGCLAEFQSAGRGRRGREWLAPFGSGLCLSFAWLFRDPPAGLSALGLAAGVAILRALGRLEIGGISLKWPNDVLRDGSKLGGVLCELRAETAGPAYVVIGIGLNVRLPEAVRSEIVASGGVRPADLAEMAEGTSVPSRALLAAALCDELVRMACEFERRGFAPFIDEWSRADALRDRPVRVQAHAAERNGVARGIDIDGALCVELGGRVERLASGEVTLRAVA